MAALIFIVSFTGIMLYPAVTFADPKPELIISIAAIGLLTLVLKASSHHRKPSQSDFAELRMMLHKEVSNIRKPPSKNKLNEYATQTGMQLDEYLGGLEIGPIIYQGMKAFMEHDYKTALKLFDKNAKAQLKKASISWFFIGNALYFQGEYNEAITAYQKSTDFNPRFAKAWYNWGVTLEALRLHEEAKEKYKKAQKLNPRRAEIDNNSSQAIKSHVPPQESKEKCQKSLESDSVFLKYKNQKDYIPVNPESHPMSSMQWLIMTLQ